MLSWLVRLSLRSRAIVVALACVSVAYGIYVASHTKLDVFPEFAPPQVVVQTEAPGLSADQVEQVVTRPLENALNGSPQLESIRSQSIQGLSAIALVFAADADVMRIRQMVSERLGEAAGELPQGVMAPKMGALTSSTSLILGIGLTSAERTPIELRSLADWTVLPRVLAVRGVANVEVFGGAIRQLQIQIDPARLVARGLSLDDVLAAARESTGIRGAGFVENDNQRMVVRTEGQALDPDTLGAVVVASRAGRSVRLRDVARVVDGAEPKFGDAQIMGKDGVLLLVHSQFGANTLDVTRGVERVLDDLKDALTAERVEVEPAIFRPAGFIERSLANVESSLLFGGVLVAFVLFVFLRDLRTALISFAAIPLSLLAAIVVLNAIGASINTLTLGGLAIAIGIVVDDAIIDVENVVRRLRERSGAAPFDIVLAASLEVRSAVVYATLIVVLVFVPVLTMSGVQGRLFAPLATSFILAVLASLAVALTVTPALCLLFLAGREPRAEPRWVSGLKRRHRAALVAISRRPRVTMAIAAGAVAAAAAMLPLFGGEFLPDFREGHFILHMAAIPGTSLAESLRIGKRVTARLLENPHVRVVAQQIGRAESGDDVWGTNLSEFHVELASLNGAESESVLGEIRRALGEFPGVTFEALSFLAERIEETISGATAEISVDVFGDDLDVLDDKAREIRDVMAQMRGAVDVQIETAAKAPELIVKLRPDRLTALGFRPLAVLDAIATAYGGSSVAQVFEGNRVYAVTAVLDPARRAEPESVGDLLVRNSEGRLLPLRSLADVSVGSSRSLIVHDGAQRRQQVTCNVDGRDVASFLNELEQRVGSRVSFPKGVYPIYGGSAQAQRTARLQLLVHSLLAAAGIVLLLATVFRNGRRLVLVLANLPFALVGGVLALFVAGGVLSIGTLVGFVGLFGITMRNSIMLVSHYQHLVTTEGAAWDLETAVRGASERLVPILMTVLVTGLGLLPLALRLGEAGQEIEGPMAVVILGGLVTSTAMNLLVLPTLCLRFGSFGSRPSSE